MSESESRFTFQPGDRVERPKDVYAKRSPLMRGTVVSAYWRDDKPLGPYPEVYDVLWDGKERIDRGYLPHGLAREGSRG